MTVRDAARSLATFTLAVGLAGSSLVAPAYADIAPPALGDLTCQRGGVATLPEVPEGATDPRGRPLRPYPYCAPSTCESDADCSDGMACSVDEISLCVREDTAAGGQTIRRIHRRGCEPDGTCLNMQSTCETSRRCVAPTAEGDTTAANEPAVDEPVDEPAVDEPAGDEPASDETATEASDTPAASPSGCGCRVTGGAASGGFAALIPLALLAWRRRRA